MKHHVVLPYGRPLKYRIAYFGSILSLAILVFSSPVVSRGVIVVMLTGSLYDNSLKAIVVVMVIML